MIPTVLSAWLRGSCVYDMLGAAWYATAWLTVCVHLVLLLAVYTAANISGGHLNPVSRVDPWEGTILTGLGSGSFRPQTTCNQYDAQAAQLLDSQLVVEQTT